MRGKHSPCAKSLEVPRMHEWHRGAAKQSLNSGTRVRQSQCLRCEEQPSRSRLQINQEFKYG
eukprot:6198514-Pleurochrysis_carterae.AAC.1